MWGLKMIGEWILFSSYAPGTGKTHRMLKYAQSLVGVDKRVLIAFINDGYRDYSKSGFNYCELALKNPLVRPYCVSLDINSIIENRPDYVVIDELGYRNLFTRKLIYQDINKIISEGISVITSCNMQIFETTNERCSAFSKIRYKYPIPDTVIDDITYIYFVDCNEDIVINRYSKGKLFPNKTKMLEQYMDKSTLQMYHKIALGELERRCKDKYEQII